MFSPESDDLIYGGNLDQWIKTAYALKARNFVHLANVGNSFLNDALQAAENAFDSNGDDFELQYTDRNLNPFLTPPEDLWLCLDQYDDRGKG